MQLAFNTSAVPELDWHDVLVQAQALGFDGVEWSVINGRLAPPDLSPALARQIGDATTACGLGVPALDCGVELPTCPDNGLEESTHRLRRFADLAAHLGADRVTVRPAAARTPVSDADALARFSEAVRAARAVAADSGIQLVVVLRSAPGWGLARRGISLSAFVNQALWLAQAGDVKVRWDVCESYFEGERADQTWDHIWPWFSYMELADMRRSGSEWLPTLLGQGEIPVAFALKYVGGAKYHGWISVSWDRVRYPELAPAAEVLADLRTYLREPRAQGHGEAETPPEEDVAR